MRDEENKHHPKVKGVGRTAPNKEGKRSRKGGKKGVGREAPPPTEGEGKSTQKKEKRKAAPLTKR